MKAFTKATEFPQHADFAYNGTNHFKIYKVDPKRLGEITNRKLKFAN